MKNVLRILTVALTVVMMVSAFVAPASAAVAVDNLESLGQKTWTVVGLAPNATAPDVTDGIVSEGEYGDAIATVVPTDSDFKVSNWTADGPAPLTDAELLEVAPERMTLYVTYDEEYLYMALVVVKAGFRSTANSPTELWGTENWLLSLYFDAYAEDRNEGDIWEYNDALSERFCVCSGLTSMAGAPNAPMALIGDNCSYMMYSAWDPVEGNGATRDDATQTTTYEFKAAWANVWGDGEEGAVPDRFAIVTQYVLADERYMANVTPGYLEALGSIRWANRVSAEDATAAGIEDATATKTIPHIIKLVPYAEPETEPATEPETEPVTEPVTEPETEAVTDAATEAVTDAATEAVTDAVTDAATEAVTDATTKAPAATEKKGCGSVIGFSAVALITAAAAVVVLKKKD